jgi:hydrogenase expression/formation protein HypC
MCLAIPAKITKITKNIAEVETMGVKKDVDITLVPEVKTGDYVIVHAGFAIQAVEEKEALEAQGYWKEFLEQAE